MRKVKFIASGHAHSFGNFAPGDIGTVDDEVARHFVEDAMCAVYDDVVQTSALAPAVEGEQGRSGVVTAPKRAAKGGRK